MSSITETSSSACSWDSVDMDWQVPEAEDNGPAAEPSYAQEPSEADTGGATFEADAPEPAADAFGLPEHSEARNHTLATAPADVLDDGFSCRRDESIESDESPIRGGVTVRDGQGILSALQAAGSRETTCARPTVRW